MRRPRARCGSPRCANALRASASSRSGTRPRSSASSSRPTSRGGRRWRRKVARASIDARHPGRVNVAKHIVCISFDFDAISGWIARGMSTPTPVSRGEFGVIGAARILALLEKRGTPATWFIPGHTLETYPEACLRVLEAGHEIGHHGWTHVRPASLTRGQEGAGLVRANAEIRK